jgi:putative transposase
MPRTARASIAGFCYHVLNRGNGGRAVFRKDRDFQTFIELIKEAGERTNMRLLAYCVLDNHFHLALWPRKDGDLSDYMRWLLTAHVRRYHQQHQSSGHIWEGRFRAFPVQQDDHLLTLLRYIEGNPVRAGLKKLAQNWPWSSAAPLGEDSPKISSGPVALPRNWLNQVNKPLKEKEIATLNECLRRGRPFGTSAWIEKTAKRLGLESSLRPPGRPKKVVTEG